jgi:hypothetical protein
MRIVCITRHDVIFCRGDFTIDAVTIRDASRFALSHTVSESMAKVAPQIKTVTLLASMPRMICSCQYSISRKKEAT